MIRRKGLKNIAFFCVLLTLVMVMIYAGVQIVESRVNGNPGESPGRVARKTITRDGEKYFQRQDITVMMILGIDQFGPVESSNYYRNNRAADTIMLLVFDEADESCSVLHLNRDTMVDMTVLGVKGEYGGTSYGQLALAHTYGTGLEDSCENMKATLEKVLPGASIDYYMALNMDAVSILNDAVGGVTVDVVDDFSDVNPSITMGEVTLQGQQAIDFVRIRKDVGNQKNVARMKRQEEYVKGFLDQLRQKEARNVNFLLNVYEEAGPYIVTDCSVSTLRKMLEQYTDYEVKEVISPEGNNVKGEEHYEFYADEEKLNELIVRLFYAPKK